MHMCFNYMIYVLVTMKHGKQECIPVGCVPAARRPYAGVCFSWGGVWSGGCAWSGGVSGSGGGVPGLGGGVSGPGWGDGVSGPGGVCMCLVWGVCPSALWDTIIPPDQAHTPCEQNEKQV